MCIPPTVVPSLKASIRIIIRLIFKNKIVKKVSSFRVSQLGLYFLISQLEYLQGIGAGAGVTSSGESVLAKRLKKSNRDLVVFDVGANRGQFTEMIDSKLEEAEIHLFEPQKSLAGKLNNEYSDESNKYINEFALSSKNSEQTLYYNEQGSGLASLTKRKLDHFDIDFDEREVVEIKTIDRYCDEVNVNKIDLLKIDVEGHEMSVLDGAEQMIRNGSIEYISFEFGGANIDTRTYFQDHYYFFDNHGYDIYRILPGGRLYKIDRYRELDEKFRTTNFVGINRRK